MFCCVVVLLVVFRLLCSRKVGEQQEQQEPQYMINGAGSLQAAPVMLLLSPVRQKDRGELNMQEDLPATLLRLAFRCVFLC